MVSELRHVHFANPLWFWGLAAVPVLFAFYALFYKGSAHADRLKRFADAHLLPHLVKKGAGAQKSAWRGLALWSLLWGLGLLAMTGPRFGYTDVPTFRPERDLVIVLDLSRTMNAADVKPSRIARARQEIDDILALQRGVTVGLVAYAAVPHMVVPLTDDMNTIRALVPALDTSLVTVQGDNLKPALEMAARMLKGAPRGSDKSILVISDGGFDAGDISGLVRAAGGARIFTMGMGTAEGAPVPDSNGGFVKNAAGNMEMSRLRAGVLQTLARLGQGIYVQANYTHDDTDAILARVAGTDAGAVRANSATVRIWNERFYIPLLLLALLLLPLFRRGAAFPAALLALLLLHPARAEAAGVKHFFFNRAQQGKIAYDAHDYATAMKKFKSPYRRGVAAYRAKKYAAAAALFKSVKNPQLAQAAQYNAANAELMGGKIEDAIAGYKAVLKNNPHDRRARHNLAIAEKLLKQKKQQQQKQEKQQGGQGKEQKKERQKSGGQKKSQSKNDRSQSKDSGGAQRKNGQQDKGGQKSGGQKDKQQQNARPKNDGAQPSAAQGRQPQPQKPDAGKNSQGSGARNQQQTSREKQQAAAAQQAEDRKNQPRAAQAAGAPVEQGSAPPTQKDIDANQWLDHIRSDPGTFLQNQFRIEEQKARAAQEENQ